MSWRNNLDRRYGFFKCTSCHKTWESSHVYCTPGTDQVQYTQDCKTCRKSFKPYKVEPIKCSICGNTSDLCFCSREDRHTDKNKPHRRDLCGKCKAGRPCASSF